jgi:hypothetical protein
MAIQVTTPARPTQSATSKLSVANENRKSGRPEGEGTSTDIYQEIHFWRFGNVAVETRGGLYQQEIGETAIDDYSEIQIS